jgi:RNA polymerase sigma-70 factor (ECF subfamily)
MLTVLAVDPHGARYGPVPARKRRTSFGPKAAGAEWNVQSDAWEWAPELFDVYGISAVEIVPSGPAMLARKHPDDLAMATTLLHAVLRGQEFSFTHRIFRKDGFVRLINTRSLIDRDSKGRPALLHAAVDVLSDWKLPLLAGDVAEASDGDLMLCLRAKMPEAMVEVFQRHRSRLIGLVHHLYPTLDPEDIVHDIFVNLFRNPEGFDSRRGTWNTYLSLQVRSRCMDVWRSQTNRQRREDASEYRIGTLAAEEEAFLSLSDLAVRAALATLPQRERLPIEMAYLDGLTYLAVSEQLGIPEGTVKSRIRKGLLRLRTHESFGNSAKRASAG